MDERTPGQIGYDAYCAATGGVSLVSGDKLPEFSALKQEIKDAWEMAAGAIAEHTRASLAS